MTVSIEHQKRVLAFQQQQETALINQVTAAALRDKITAAGEAVAAAQAQLTVAREQLRDKCLADLGTSLGGVIKAKGQEYKLTKAEVWDFKDNFVVSVHGVPRLKNGTFGNRANYIGTDWAVVP